MIRNLECQNQTQHSMEVDLSMVFIGYISKISDFLDPISLNTAKKRNRNRLLSDEYSKWFESFFFWWTSNMARIYFVEISYCLLSKRGCWRVVCMNVDWVLERWMVLYNSACQVQKGNVKWGEATLPWIKCHHFRPKTSSQKLGRCASRRVRSVWKVWAG